LTNVCIIGEKIIQFFFRNIFFFKNRYLCIRHHIVRIFDVKIFALAFDRKIKKLAQLGTSIKFGSLIKIYIFYQSFDFWSKFKLFTQIWIFRYNFWSKFGFLNKIWVFGQNLDFWYKFNFLPKIVFLTKIRILANYFKFFWYSVLTKVSIIGQKIIHIFFKNRYL